MSVVAKRVGIDSPRQFHGFNIYYLGGNNIDASPIYSSFKMTVSIAGSYSSATHDFAYSYTNSKTWNREEIRADSIIGPLPFEVINGEQEFPIGSYGTPRSPSTGKFTMGLFPAMDMNPTPFPMFVPAFPAAGFVLENGGRIETGAIIGTKTNIITSVSENIVENISSGVPTFSIYFTSPTDPRFFVDGFECSAGATGFSAVISEDATAWTAAKWRDFRGTYVASNTDANGITTDIELVLG